MIFFFQAEDGIRDHCVTGVQTCALPISAVDVPGIDTVALALSGKTFGPSTEAEAFLANQLDALRSEGAVGRHIISIADAYAAGVNAYYAARGIQVQRFTANDVIAAAALI